MKTIKRVLKRIIHLIGNFGFFVWIGIVAAWDWLQFVIHPIFKFNGFVVQVFLFVWSLAFSPFPWWTAFIFMFIPFAISIPLCAVFFIMFILELALNVVFI